MNRTITRWTAATCVAAFTGAASAAEMASTPITGWSFFRNDNGATILDAGTNSPTVGPLDGVSPDTTAAAAISAGWGSTISLEIGEVARVTGQASWSGAFFGPGLRLGLFTNDGDLSDGSTGYKSGLEDLVDGTFDGTWTGRTDGFVFSTGGDAINLAPTVNDEQGTWEDNVTYDFTFEIERTNTDAAEIRFFMSGLGADPVNIDTVATHASGIYTSFDTFGFLHGGSNAMDVVTYTDINIEVTLAASPLTGDLNGDGFVGQDDLNIVLGAWGTNVTPGDPLAGDPSGDGFVGQDDLNDVLAGWGQGTPPSNLIPEPASAALLALGGLAMLRRRRV